jgi:hypothetical protein
MMMMMMDDNARYRVPMLPFMFVIHLIDQGFRV